LSSLTKHSLVALVAIIFGCSSGGLAQAYSDNCEEKFAKPRAENLDQLMKQSDFIALYRAVKSVDGIFKTGGHHQAAIEKTHLTLSKELKNEAPSNLELYGRLTDTSSIPSEYFHIKDIHQAIVDHDILIMGLSYEVMLPDETCVYSTSFIKGYEYLIFGNGNSRVSIEPILHRKFDPLYKSVVKRISVLKNE